MSRFSGAGAETEKMADNFWQLMVSGIFFSAAPHLTFWTFEKNDELVKSLLLAMIDLL